DLDASALVSGQYFLTVRCKRQVRDLSWFLGRQPVQRFAGGSLPQTHRAVLAAGGDRPAARRDGDGGNWPVVGLERQPLRPGLDVPQPDRLLLTAIDEDKGPAVRRKG